MPRFLWKTLKSATPLGMAMATSRSAIVLDGPEATPDLAPGSTQTARLRVSLAKPPEEPCLLPVRLLDVPAGWQVRAEPAQVRLSSASPSASIDVRVTVPEDAPDGDRQVWVRVDHDGAGAGLGVPVHVRRPARRWGLAAATVGTGAAIAAGYAAWRITRRLATSSARLPARGGRRKIHLPAMPRLARRK